MFWRGKKSLGGENEASGKIKLPRRRLGRLKKRVSLPTKKDRKVKFAALRNFGVGEERYFFVENLSMLLTSGMDLISALEAIRSEVRTRRMKKVIDELKDDAAAGVPIWRSLHRQKILKPYVVALIKIGEQAGKLVDNLQVIVTQQQKDSAFRSKLRAAMTYPILVLSVAFIIGLGLSVFILPRLAGVFGSLHIDLPLITRVLLEIGSFMKVHGYVVTPIFIVVFVVVIYLVFFAPKTKKIGQWIMFKLPGIKRLIREVELARMGYVLGTLLEAGMPVVDAIRSLHDATSFYNYKKLYGHVADQVNVGESLRSALNGFRRSKKMIPQPIQQMIIAGEQSGRLPAALKKIGQMYEEKTEATAKNLTTVLEPLLLIIVWLGVAGVALAVIMPIYGLIGNLNQARTAPRPSATPIVATATPVATPTPLIVAPTSLRVVGDGGRVNVRSAPDLAAAVVTTVKDSETYNFDDSRENNDGDIEWYHIVISENLDAQDEEDITGWIYAEFAEVIDANATDEEIAE